MVERSYRQLVRAAQNLIDDVNELGYEVDLYATDISDAISSLPGRVQNVHSVKPNVDPAGAVASLVKCSLYRDAPGS